MAYVDNAAFFRKGKKKASQCRLSHVHLEGGSSTICRGRGEEDRRLINEKSRLGRRGIHQSTLKRKGHWGWD